MSDRAFRAWIKANKLILEESAEIPVTILNTFLAVVIWGQHDKTKEPLTIQELADKIDIPYQSVSRHLRYLGYGIRQGEEGMGLVETREYVLNRRQKSVHLTPKGWALVGRMSIALKGIGNGDLREGAEVAD